jgi:hypothetical protein
MRDQSAKSNQQIICAEDIVKEITQGSRGLQKSLLPWRKPLLPLKHKTIRGCLDLKSLVIDKPLEIRCCHFEHDVDLRYCEFKQVVDFSGCTFQGRFNSGDESATSTVYHKDLICKGACFRGTMSLNGAQVEGRTDFSEASFMNKECSAELTGSTFEKTLKCEKAKYKGKANFRSVRCAHSAVLTNAGFAADVDLRYLKVGCDLDLTWTCWAGRAKLGQIQVSRKLLLNGACFKGDVDLYDSSIGTLELWDPNHRADQAMQVRTEHGLKSVIPSNDKLQDWCKDPNPSVFPELKCKLRNKKEADCLTYELFPFKKGLEVTSHEARGLFGELSILLVRFVRRPVDHLRLTKPAPRKEPTQPGLNLTGTTFERFHGGPVPGQELANQELAKRLAERLADQQDPTKFSIDPYLQLSKHYHNIGDEYEAKEMHVRGYDVLRENAQDTGRGRSKWTSRRLWAEWLLYGPTRYGYRIWPLVLVPMLIFFIFGTFMFWSHEGLVAIKGTGYGAPHDAPLAQKVFERFVYSLDLFIPALDLRYAAMWEPKSGWLGGWAYATFHSIFGWLLIALFISWLTGAIKPPK